MPRKEHVDMPEETPEEDEEEMAEEEEEEGTTSISEIGTSVMGDLDMGMNIASLGKSFGAELQRNILVSAVVCPSSFHNTIRHSDDIFYYLTFLT